MMYLKIFIVLMIGLCAGWFIFGAKKSNGTLYIMQNSDPEEPDIYRFEIDDLENLTKHKKIFINVKTIPPS